MKELVKLLSESGATSLVDALVMKIKPAEPAKPVAVQPMPMPVGAPFESQRLKAEMLVLIKTKLEDFRQDLFEDTSKYLTKEDLNNLKQTSLLHRSQIVTLETQIKKMSNYPEMIHKLQDRMALFS